MSHNYPYRRPPSDTDLRPEVGHYSSADRRHISPEHDFYRPSQESFSSSYSSSSSSRGSTSAPWAQDGALSILSSCGLEPSDLALLAELPEDVLTVESLPHVLKQIKGKRGTISSFPPNTLSPSSSYSSSSYHQPPVSSSGVWDQDRSQPIQYPLDHVAPGSLPSEQDHWRISRSSSSVRLDPTSSSASSSSSRYTVDFHHKPGPSQYGKTGRSAGPVFSQDLPSYSSAGQGKRSRPTGFSEPRAAPYPEVYRPKPRGGRHEFQTSSIGSSNRHAAATSMPSEKKALDFHGTCPTVFPYSCSLCDITVLSEKVWIKHINGTQHAEGQLSLLQQFPNWDCRVESVSRAKNQLEKGKDEEKTPHSPQTATQNHKSKSETKPEKKTSEKGKVVCVKFPPQSVDEAYLRKLTEPFGKIVKILMFPSLAFLELGSTDQAKELVKFHVKYPPTVNGEQIEFSVSNTFNFLQSSQVVSFTPVPTGEYGQSDLISIVKRFGTPLYTLFLPSMAFVEMKTTSDAQKLVDYYSSTTLRINNSCIKVSFSGEYKTLLRVPSAKKYEEEKISTKRTSLSREEEDKAESKRRQRSSKEQEQERKKSSRERRSRSREKSSKEKRTRTRSRSRAKSDTERKTRSRSRDKSDRNRSKSREKSSKERKTRSRSKSRDKSSNRSSVQDGSREKSVEGEKPEPESRTKDEPAPLGEAAETQQMEEKAASSAEDSDIEGMEVIGEDGENVEEEDMEIQNNAEEEEREHQAERTDLPEECMNKNCSRKCHFRTERQTFSDTEVETKAGNEEDEGVVCATKKPEEESEAKRETKEAAEVQLEDDEEESDFPVDLENCITLDELEEDQSDNQDEDVGNEAESPSSRVVYFRDLPLSFYTDTEFINLVKHFGKAERYFLIRQNQEGFIEMSSSSEAQRAVEELSCKSVTLNGSKLIVNISHQYQRLSNGWEVQLDLDHEKRSRSQSSSERQSESKTPDRDETCKKSEGEEEKTPEEESGREESTHESASENAGHKESWDRKTEEDLNVTEKESDVRKTPEKERTPENKSEKTDWCSPDYRGTPDKELACTNTPEEEPVSEKTEHNNSAATTPKDSAAKKSPEKELLSEMSQETDGLKRKSIPDKDSDPKRSPEESENKNETPETECEERSCEGHRVCSEEETSEPAVKSPDQPGSSRGPPKPQTEQKTEYDDQLQDSDTVQVEEGPEPGPAGGAAELEEPTKPIGTEFVRPVVGYFCNLCQLIYADEDEAKLQHCSSLMHYRKYQEKTGKDPWTS